MYFNLLLCRERKVSQNPESCDDDSENSPSAVARKALLSRRRHREGPLECGSGFIKRQASPDPPSELKNYNK